MLPQRKCTGLLARALLVEVDSLSFCLLAMLSMLEIEEEERSKGFAAPTLVAMELRMQVRRVIGFIMLDSLTTMVEYSEYGSGL